MFQSRVALFSLIWLVALAGVASSQNDGEIHPSIWPESESPVGLDPKIESRITKLISQMTLRQKVGQVIQADIGSIQPDDLKSYPLGSVLNGGNSAPGGDNRADAQAWLDLADAFYQASRQCDLQGGPYIPLMWGTDAVHGHNNIVGATFFPHNIGLGATRNPKLLREIGAVTAKEIRVTGQEWTFAPTIAVVRDDRWGRTYEGYSEDPAVTASYTGELIEGIQGVAGHDDFLTGAHVIATAKHFVGDGGTFGGKDQGDNQMSEEDLRDLQAAGYPVAINAGVQCVMASFSSWQGKKIHGHRGLLTDVLKGRMGFDGFIVGDWNAHGQVPGCTVTDALPVLNAGLDMFMAPDSWKGMFESLMQHAEAGEVDMARLDDAVRRILRVKLRAKLFDAGLPSTRAFAGDFDQLGKPEHRDVARRAVRQSLVLLKNNENTLPLSPSSTILVAGDGADNIGKQCGGWSLSWQGTGNSNDDFPGGTSIYDGLKAQMTAAGGDAILASEAAPGIKPDAVLVVFGEDPYAEFQGDVETLAYKPEDRSDLQLLKQYHDQGIPTVGVFLSGRPLWVNAEINATDAFVAAWLPGSEGVGVADVLLAKSDGTPQYDFQGKLPYSWPRTPDQTPLNLGDENYDPLFAYGYGLTYGDQVTVGELAESYDARNLAGRSRFFQAGRAVAPWQMTLSAGDETVAVRATRAATTDGTLQIYSADEKAQEDIRVVRWNGSGPAAFAFTSQTPVELASDQKSIRIRMRVDQPASEDVTLRLSAGGSSATVSITDRIAAAGEGQWVNLTVPMTSFSNADAALSGCSGIEIATDGRLQISVSDIDLR
ncbi:glycoside hydrolase family 3 protein [Crateriforma spongiae]|uniref:glycoside hydrolase family 3 protein n=1 Tax=Crateriforma spongiae TaxID=2724528 RepID=UPI0014469809|nr:glycoside hydrolase family 3 protein [Crateriforma spongiae]